MANPNSDQLIASTLSAHMRRVTDNFFTTNMLWSHLVEKKRIKKRMEGGLTIKEPIRIGGNDNGGYYEKYDTLRCKPNDGLSHAEYRWVQHYTCVTICGYEECVNSGNYAAFSLIDEKMDQTSESTFERWNKDLALNNGSNPKELLGLPAIVSDTLPLGDIDPADCEQWRSMIDDGGYADWQAANPNVPASEFPGKPLLISDIYAMKMKLGRNGKRINCIIMSCALYQDLMAQCAANSIETQTSGGLSKGYDSLTLWGIEVGYDHDLPEGDVYLLNTDRLKLICCKDRLLKNQGLRPGEDSDTKKAYFFTMFQLTTNERRAHGRLCNRRPLCLTS